jgi:copper chaperone CopZ
VARVEQVLAGQEGVDGAVVDLASSQARVTLTSAASTDTIVEAVTKVGYTISLLS